MQHKILTSFLSVLCICLAMQKYEKACKSWDMQTPTSQGFHLSCHVICQCSAVLQDRRAYWAGTHPPLPSQTLASQGQTNCKVRFALLWIGGSPLPDKEKTWIKHLLNISMSITEKYLKFFKLRNTGQWRQAHRRRAYHLRSGASPSSVACLHIHKVVVHGTWMVVLQQSHLTLWTQVFYHITTHVYQGSWCINGNGCSGISLALKFYCVNIFR